MELFLGIDGGQSSTVAMIADEVGRVIGSAVAGPCNHVSSAEASAKLTQVVNACVSDACNSAGLDPLTTRFTGACCGMSGGPADKKDLLLRIIRADHLTVKTDGEISLTGALAGQPGIVVIAGTGSIAYGRDRFGKVCRAGGWGYIFGDEGSAFDIVRQAVRACLRQQEGWGSKTTLLPALLDATKVQSANDLLHLFYTPEWARSRIAALAELVDKVSYDDDAIARKILEEAGEYLASLAGFLRVQLVAKNGATQVSFSGGVFHSRVVVDRYQAAVGSTQGCRCSAPAMDPAAGALLEAYMAIGRPISLSNIPVLK